MIKKFKDFTSNKNELNKLSKKKKKKKLRRSTKRLTEGLINKFFIFSGSKYFSSGIFQNYLVFTPAIKHVKCFLATTQIYSWKSNGTLEERIENILDQTANLLQLLLIIIHY